jgi:hypothetical protein
VRWKERTDNNSNRISLGENMNKTFIAAAAAALLSACSAMTTISSPKEGTTLLLQDRTVNLPHQETLKGTSFGNYAFKAVDGSSDPLYGILPLKFKGGHLAVDIIFFAPAAFFNLREVFPFYEIDVGKGVIRYKNSQNEGWTEYKPKPEESAHARSFFETKLSAVGSH